MLGRLDAPLRQWEQYLPPMEGRRVKTAEKASELFSEGPLDLLAVAPGVTVGEEERLPACRLLLLPGANAPLIGRVNAPCVMSYGISSKDSLTVSSLEADHLALAIQRELVTISGGTVERQELILGIHGITKPIPWVYWVGVLLILGIPVESLPALLEGEAQSAMGSEQKKTGII